jgi:eukaryotic-like serine/threonine-protein kinase
VRACLEKDPGERVQTAQDVRIHLRWISEGGSQAGVPAPVAARRRGRERMAWTLVAVTGLAAVVLAVLHFGRPVPAPQTLRFTTTPPTSVKTMDSPRISPDGRTLAYSATDSTGTSMVWIRPLGSLTAQVLPGTEGANRPFWSPDSRFLAFTGGGKLRKISVSGGPTTVICDTPTGADGTWSRDGVILFDGTDADPILRVSSGGGVPSPIVSPDTATHVSQVGWPEFLPDGRHFLYLAILPAPTLRVRSLDGKTSRDLGPCESQVQYIPPGYLLFSRGGSLVIQRFDTRALKFTGEPIPVAEQVGTTAVGGSDFRASQNGVLVYSTRLAESGELVELDRAGLVKRMLPSQPNALMPTLSPDERRVAVRVLDPTARTRDIWLVDRERSISSRFTFDKGNENYPLWSPDGKRIAYWIDAPGASGIMAKQLTGSGDTEMLMPSAQEVTLKDWSRDGSTIFYESGSVTGSDIWMLPLTGDRKPRPFLNASYSEYDPHLSPDGRFLAYVSNESGREEVYVQTYPDRSDKWQVSNRGGNDPRWSADGREMFYLSPDNQMISVPIRMTPTFDPGEPKVLFDSHLFSPGGQRMHYSVTGDGQTFILYRTLSTRSLPTTTVVVNWLADVARR